MAFRDQYRACEVFNELRRRDWDWVVDLDQALVVRMDEDGKLRVFFSIDPANHKAPAWARAWSSFLRLIIPSQMANGLVAAATQMTSGHSQEDSFDAWTPNNDIAWWREKIRVSEQFV